MAMMDPASHSGAQIVEASGGVFLAAGLALFSGFSMEAFGILAGGLAVYFLRESVPWRRRIFYAITSIAIGAVLAPGLSDLALVFFPELPETLRPPIGLLAVCAAIPFVEAWRGSWRRLADDPEQLWKWITDRLPWRPRS